MLRQDHLRGCRCAPEPQQVLAEAFRVLRPGGQIAVFDGDYNTMTVATSSVHLELLRAQAARACS